MTYLGKHLAGKERLEKLSVLSLFAFDSQLLMLHCAGCVLFSASRAISQPGTIYQAMESQGETSSAVQLHRAGDIPLRHDLV